MIPPILITGAARSGTSLTAGIISICGAFGGNATGSTPYNKNGQFENTHIRQHIMKPYLVRMGADKMGQRPLPDVHNLLPFSELRGEVEQTMRREGYSTGPWYYKGAKMCLVWPTWHRAFPRAQWIVVRRNPEDIADSCMRTPFMRKYNTVEGWLSWVKEHEKIFSEMMQMWEMDVTEIHIEDIVRGDFSVIKNFVDMTDGLRWSKHFINQFVDPKLWKQGKEVIANG